MGKVRPMAPADQVALLKSYEPAPGAAGTADAWKRHDELARAIRGVNADRAADPAAAMIAQSPAVAEARSALNAALSDPNTDPAVLKSAVHDYVTKQTIEQQRLAPGAPVRIVPNAYIDDLNKRFGSAAVPGTGPALLGQVEAERQRWGDAWPLILRQLDKTAEPVVRVISKPGVNPAAAQQLAELAPITFDTIAKDQSETKRGVIKSEVLSAFKPLMATLDGQADAQRTFDDYRSQGEKLAARYVTRGMDMRAAAARAYAELVLHSYDMRDTFRVPKTAGVPADDVQLGAAAARRDLGAMNIAPARDTFGGLSPEYVERETIRAYQRDGRWVTAPNDDGLGLVYDHLPVRTRDGTPVFLTWAQLGARAADARRAEAEPVVWGSPTLPQRARGQQAQRDFRRALHDEPFDSPESKAGPVRVSQQGKAPSSASEGTP